MARTSLGVELTERHRQAQLELRAGFLREFIRLWPLMDWLRIDQVAAAWVRAVVNLLQAWRQESAELAERYYAQYRQVELPNVIEPAPRLEYIHAPDSARQRPELDDLRGRAVDLRGRGQDARTGRGQDRSARGQDRYRDGLVKPRIDWSDWDLAAARSMLVTGPGYLKVLFGRGEPEERAMRAGLEKSASAASRHVLNGGRTALLTLVESDDRALGWARVTDSDPCAFCAMLASRGPAYKTQESASFQPHDGCACTAEPVFSRSAAWPGKARDYQRLWYDATRGYSGQDAINAFRRAYERQRREDQRPEPSVA